MGLRSSWTRIHPLKRSLSLFRIGRRIAQGFSEPFDALWAYVEDTPLEERFTDEELDRLARRLAPMIAQYLQRD